MDGNADTEIEQIEYDSRLIEPGSLFVAVKGYERDGFDFVDQAIQNGAVAVLGERESCEQTENYVRVTNSRIALAGVSAAFYGFPGMKLKACGVTGTNGKTTTCFLLKSILEARNKRTGLITSVLYDTGKDQFDAERTTPESLDLQRLLLLMRQNYCVNAVIEVSSHALMLHRVDHINFRVAVFTNISRDHLDFHKTMEDYLEAKKLLLKKLTGPLSYAVINLDVPEFRPLFGEFNSSYISFSLSDTNADVYCSAYEIRPNGTTFDLVTPMGSQTVELKLPGRFNLKNAIAAIAAGLASGIDIDSVIRGLERAKPVAGRFNYVDAGQPFAVYVDYAHTPDAIKRLCESARELCNGRMLILFGCGGDRDRGKREMMGKAATTAADYVVVTSDNPRSEEPQAIIDEIKPGLVKGKFEIVIDRAEAIGKILRMAKPNDVILLAGKGSEPYQEVKGERTPFSDEREAYKELTAMGYSIGGDEKGN